MEFTPETRLKIISNISLVIHTLYLVKEYKYIRDLNNCIYIMSVMDEEFLNIHIDRFKEFIEE